MATVTVMCLELTNVARFLTAYLAVVYSASCVVSKLPNYCYYYSHSHYYYYYYYYYYNVTLTRNRNIAGALYNVGKYATDVLNASKRPAEISH